MLPSVAANSLVFVLLNDTEQLGLQKQGQFADLVEEESATVCQGEGPIAGVHRSSEGATLVSEELATGQLRRHCRAVHHDQFRLVASRIQIVY